jgi:hypothetical protein
VLCLGSPDNRAKVCRKLQHYYREADVRLNLAHHPHPSHLLSHCIDKDGLDSPEFWIAHGGGVGEFFYTNCKEAVHDSLDKGFTYIEIDLAITTDGHLVGAHTWSELKALLGSEELSDAPMSRADIEALRPRWRRTPLFAEDICRIMQEHPGMVLVTDKVQDFELLRQQIPFADRMIVEAFSLYDCLQAYRAGFRNVALSAWSVEGMHQARQYKLPGVVLAAPVLNANPAAEELAAQMHQEGCCIMVHGSSICDSADFIHKYLGRSISRIYTNTWSPTEAPEAP